jgi:hypothetical protein
MVPPARMARHVGLPEVPGSGDQVHRLSAAPQLVAASEAPMINYSLGTDPQKLRALADWLDNYDDDRAYGGIRDVQADLRRIADEIESREVS